VKDHPPPRLGAGLFREACNRRPFTALIRALDRETLDSTKEVA